MSAFCKTSLALAATILLIACQPANDNSAATTAGADPAAATSGKETSPVTELQIIDVQEGDGATAAAGQTVVVHYTGWLHDPAQADNKGAKFDSSVDRNQPFQFPLGAGRVIRGWDEGVAGMQVGGKRLLVIPPAMGYGERGAGGVIPPNATLLFEVDLLDIR